MQLSFVCNLCNHQLLYLNTPLSNGELTNTLDLKNKKRLITSKIKDVIGMHLLNNIDVENVLLHKRVLPSQRVLQQIPQVFTKQYLKSSQNYEPNN